MYTFIITGDFGDLGNLVIDIRNRNTPTLIKTLVSMPHMRDSRSIKCQNFQVYQKMYFVNIGYDQGPLSIY